MLEWLYNLFGFSKQSRAVEVIEPQEALLGNLPENVLVNTLRQMPLASVLAFSKVNQAAHQAANDPLVWQSLIQRYFPHVAKAKPKDYQHKPRQLFKNLVIKLEVYGYPAKSSSMLIGLTGDETQIEQTKDVDKRPLYMAAVANGYDKFSEKIDHLDLEHSLYLAIYLYHLEAVNTLWNKIDDGKCLSPLEKAIICAVEVGNISLVQFFVGQYKKRISHDMMDDFIQYAVWYNQIEIIKYLLLQLESPISFDWIIEIAYMKKNLEMIALLEQAKAQFAYQSFLGTSWANTIFSPVLQVGESVLHFVPDIFANMQTQHIVKVDDTLERFLNKDVCYREDKARWERGIPQALIVQPSALSLRDTFASWLSKMTFSKNYLYGYLAQYFSLYAKTTATLTDMCEVIEKASKHGPIKFLKISGHGDSGTYSFGGDGPNEMIEVRRYFNDLNQDLSCLRHLAKGAIILLESCTTASSNTIYFNTTKGTSIPFDLNILKLIAMHAPGSFVLSPEFLIERDSISLRLFPQVKAHAYGASTDSVSSFIGSLARSIGLNFLAPSYTHYSGYTPEILIKELSSVTPQNAPFCSEVIPYFLMQKYCDAINLHPTLRDIKTCANDDDCRELGLFLKMLQMRDTCRSNVDGNQYFRLLRKGEAALIDHDLRKKLTTCPAPSGSEDHELAQADVQEEPQYLYQGAYAGLNAFTASFVKEHLRFKQYSSYATSLATRAVSLGFQIAVVTKSVSNIRALAVSSVCNHILSDTFLAPKVARYVSSGLFFGYYLHRCYQNPEQTASTVGECLASVAGTLVGDRLGQYAYRLFMSRSAANPKQIETKVSSKLLKPNCK